MAKKYRAHKDYSIDVEVCEQWEKLVKSQGKNYSEQLEEDMRRDIENNERNNCPTVSKTPAPTSALIPSENFDQFIWERIKPSLDKDMLQLTIEEKSSLDDILRSAKKLVARIETKFGYVKIVKFEEIPKWDRLEAERLRQLQIAREYRETKDRYDHLQALPLLIEDEIQDIIQEQAQEDTLTEAQLWALQQSEEQRRMKLRTPDKPLVMTITTNTNEEGIIQE